MIVTWIVIAILNEMISIVILIDCPTDFEIGFEIYCPLLKNQKIFYEKKIKKKSDFCFEDIFFGTEALEF